MHINLLQFPRKTGSFHVYRDICGALFLRYINFPSAADVPRITKEKIIYFWQCFGEQESKKTKQQSSYCLHSCFSITSH